MRDEFYRIRGWDPVTGVPTHSKLRELGLNDAAEGLEIDMNMEKRE